MTASNPLAELAALDDTALVALANRGLLRRAALLVESRAIEPVPNDAPAPDAGPPDDGELRLSVDGTVVSLRPGGAAAARCPCPVAGVCVHVIAACLWARGAADPAEAPAAAPASLRDEVLAWGPDEVMRAAGAAAVRRATGSERPGAPRIVDGGGRLSVEWTEGPTVVFVPGAGPRGTIVSGSPSTPVARYWTLLSVVAVAEAAGRTWAWPEDAAAASAPARRDAAVQLGGTIERIVAQGLASTGAAEAELLARAAEAARLEDLRLLARLAQDAGRRLSLLIARSETASAGEAFSALAQAWALATRLAAGTAADPGEGGLVGASATEPIDRIELVPLSVRWWRDDAGGRGLTLQAVDRATGRREQATAARAAGADPGFEKSWDTPLLWGASAQTLCSGVLTLSGAERRDDGTLAASTRTRVAVSAWGGIDLDALAAGLDGDADALERTRFGAAAERVRVIVPRRRSAVGALELDDEAQELVMPIVDADGRSHRLTVPATESWARRLAWTAERKDLAAITASGSRPDAVFLRGKDGALGLVSLTLSPLHAARTGDWWRPRRRQGRERTVAPSSRGDELDRLCAACADIAETLLATGRHSLAARQTDALRTRARQSRDLGLETLAAAIEALLAHPSPSALLWLRFVLDRLSALRPSAG